MSAFALRVCVQRVVNDAPSRQALDLGQRAGLGLDKTRAFSRHRTIATLMIYVDETDRAQTQKTLGDLVASTLTA